MALRSAVFSELDAGTIYAGGKTGVWISRNGGVTFSSLDKGFPNNPYDMDTLSLLLVENETGSRLLAGTRQDSISVIRIKENGEKQTGKFFMEK